MKINVKEINIPCQTYRNGVLITGIAIKIETKYRRSRFGRSNGYVRLVTFAPNDGGRKIVKDADGFFSMNYENHFFDNV